MIRKDVIVVTMCGVVQENIYLKKKGKENSKQ